MILSFTASNYRSIYDEQTISFVATRLKEDRAPFVVDAGRDVSGVLPCAVIYGANAAGKSNMISALRFMVGRILRSHRNTEPTERIPIERFLLSSDASSSPSRFEIDFIAEGTRYNFGFEIGKDGFDSEWLYCYPEGRRRRLYERSGQEIEFGPSFKGEKKVFASLMRPNSLFISAATQNRHEELSLLIDFFREVEFVPDAAPPTLLPGMEIGQSTIRFLSEIGTGIVDFKKEETEIPEGLQKFMKELSLAAQKHLEVEGSALTESGTREEIRLGHQTEGAEVIYFPFDRESSGTRRLLTMMGSVFDVLSAGSLLLVDEIDLSLHTKAVESIIQLFVNPLTNPNAAQLLATTHDTNLLSSPLLRRDEVWFVEKGQNGASSFFPLSEFHTRKSDDFERGYLDGRFGAVPHG